MQYTNSDIMSMARQSLSGRWGQAIGAFLLSGLIQGLFTLILGGPISLGRSLYALKVARDESTRLEDIFSGFNDFGRSLLAFIIFVLAVVMGFILLVIPGIVIAMMYSMTFFIMAEDKNITAMDALRESRAIMEGHKMQLFGLNLIFMLLTFLSVFTLFIGLLWLIPFIWVCNAHFYEAIKGERQASSSDIFDADYKV